MAKTSGIEKAFMWSAIVQGGILAVVTFVMFVFGSIYLSPSPAAVIAFGSAGIWLMLGYVMYIVMILALGITSLFYDYIEVRLNRKLDRISLFLARSHLILMNFGMLGATLLLMYAGYVGGVGLMPTSVGGGGLTQLQVHEQILGQFPKIIIALVVMTLLGALAGGAAYARTLMSKR